MNFKNLNKGHIVTDEFGVTYSEDGGILLYADPQIFNCSEYHISSQVRVIWDYAFEKVESLEKVVFERCYDSTSLLYIGEFAFALCRNLREIDIPDSVIHMEQCIFDRCTSLKRVHLPCSITSIPCECFNMCESLESVNIPHGVRCIEICGFRGCSSLEEITLPDTLEWLEDTAFTGCGLRSIHLPGNLRFIGEDCFRDCPLDELVVPESVTEIVPWPISWHPLFKGVVCRSKNFRVEEDALIDNGDDSMLCCWSGKEVYTIPVSVRNIRGFANSHVRKIVADHPIDKITYDCFGGCTSLKEICLKEVNDIDDSALYGLDNVSLIVGGKPREIPRTDKDTIRAIPYKPFVK